MNRQRVRRARNGMIVLMAALLAGCGGGGDGGGGTVAPVTYSISGRVTSSGNGLSGVTVALTGAASATTTTGATGDYTFPGLDNGSYTVTPSRTGFTFNPANSAQDVSGANRTAVDFTVASAQNPHIVTCPPSGTTNVSIASFSFTPPGVTIIGANGVVKWTNSDPVVHTVTSGTPPNANGLFDSGNLGAGATVCVLFPASGVFPYFCTLHQFMLGVVTVTVP